MRLSLDWLKDFVLVKENPVKTAEIFTLLGFEVETVEPVGRELEGIVVVKIIGIRKHPQADRLQLATVTDGNKKQVVVCGATNIKIGQIVPLARVGVVLPGERKIERVSIRGVVSEGMLCSAKELGLGADHEGIYILDDSIKIGQSLPKALGLNDTVFDITVSPNRADCLSVEGLAREYAAQTGRSLKQVKYPLKTDSQKSTLSILNKELKLCPRYTAREITDVRVKESPDWIKNRLSASGIRPINNIVDATNYLMLETGQPIHAFDADKLASTGNQHKIIIRKAAKQEIIKTLDGEERKLNPSMIVIADEKKPIALAGVMGGSASEVTSETKNIILEVAAFDRLSIRKTSQQLGLRSESSSRFEKGIDISRVESVSDKAASLIASLGNGKVSSKMHSAGTGVKKKTAGIKLEFSEVERLLGIAIPKAEIKKYLKCLGFKIVGQAKYLTVTAPTWRNDINIAADLIEEIGRLYGYNKLVPTFLKGSIKPSPEEKIGVWSEKLRDTMVNLGYSEVYNYSFYDIKSAESVELPVSDHYQVTNPMSPEQTYLRASLIPRMKENLRRNRTQQPNVKLFEIGRTFHPGPDLPKEHTVLAVAVAYEKTKPQEIIFELKGVLNIIARSLQLNALLKINELRKGIYNIKLGEAENIGLLQVFSTQELNRLKLTGYAGSFGIRLDRLVKQATDRIHYRAYSSYPAMERDLAVIIDEKIDYLRIAEAICRVNKSTINNKEPNGLIADLGLFGEIYRGKSIGANKKSLPIRIIYQSPNRTLNSKEVDKIQNKIISQLNQEIGARIKGINN